jgi:hypothetical protein
VKKILVLLIGLLMCLAAQAAPPCDPTQKYSATETYMRFQPDWYDRVNEGWYVMVACRNHANQSWDIFGGACRHGVCNQSDWWHAIANFGTAEGAEAKKASFVASWDKIIVQNCNGDQLGDDAAVCAVYKQKVDALLMKLHPIPIPVLYAVRKNGTYPTRPAYAWDGTARGVAEVGRATVGADCMIVVGDYGRFAPEWRPDRLALCSPVSTP